MCTLCKPGRVAWLARLAPVGLPEAVGQWSAEGPGRAESAASPAASIRQLQL